MKETNKVETNMGRARAVDAASVGGGSVDGLELLSKETCLSKRSALIQQPRKGQNLLLIRHGQQEAWLDLQLQQFLACLE